MKRLLCIISNMNAGGAESFLMKLYRRLDRTSYQIDFCVNVFEENFYEKEILQLGGVIYRIPPRKENIKEHNNQLKDIIIKNNYRYILAVSSSATSYIDLKIAKKAGAEICSIRSSNSNIGMPIKYKFLQWFFKILYSKNADRLIAPSDLAAINMFGKKYYKDSRYVFLRNGLDVDDFEYSIKSRKYIRDEFKINDENLVIGHVGRFYKQKNHEFLIDVFSKIVEKNNNARLLMVGSGELEGKIYDKVVQNHIQDYVVFAGTRTDVNKILSAMDIFVFPSFFEGMPNTIIEAQASGLTCLISDTITKQVNITGDVHFLSIKDDPELWAEQTLCLLENKEKNRNNKQYFIEHNYDIDSCVNCFVHSVYGE